MKLELRAHPPVLFAYTPNHVGLIIKIKNTAKKKYWAEADIVCSEKLSLASSASLNKGRTRMGIIGPKEYMEKIIKVYADTHTPPRTYTVKVTAFFYDKNAVIQKRIEEKTEIKCEVKKKAVLD
ncbi:hypothetical protein JXB01_04540 [Candidatus Micrarchaeota archaeon]|nr:hypothetical protein [Candidatus Micrarchaeota archaeon]